MESGVAGIDRSIADTVVRDVNYRIIGRALTEAEAIQPGQIPGSIGAALVGVEVPGQNLGLDFIEQFAGQTLLHPGDIREGSQSLQIFGIHIQADIFIIQDRSPAGKSTHSQFFDQSFGSRYPRMAIHLHKDGDDFIGICACRQHPIPNGGSQFEVRLIGGAVLHELFVGGPTIQFVTGCIIGPHQISVVGDVVNGNSPRSAHLLQPIVFDRADKLNQV